MTLREIIAKVIEPQAWAALGLGDKLAYLNRRTSSERKATRILEALTSAGYRILGPDDLDGPTGWQPIETAPKGKLLLYFPRTDGRNALPSMIKVDCYPVAYPRKPTRWMPLPAEPTAIRALAKEKKGC